MGNKKPESLDKQIAMRIRALRKEHNLSQTELAKALGVSFQQVQKYELGLNRISAARLYQLAKIFDLSVQALFPDEDKPVPRGEKVPKEALEVSTFALSADGWRLCKAFLKIKSTQKRKAVIDLVREMSES